MGIYLKGGHVLIHPIPVLLVDLSEDLIQKKHGLPAAQASSLLKSSHKVLRIVPNLNFQSVDN